MVGTNYSNVNETTYKMFRVGKVEFYINIIIKYFKNKKKIYEEHNFN